LEVDIALAIAWIAEVCKATSLGYPDGKSNK
jgi:hypothetical protein